VATFLTQNDWRLELVIQGESYGLWDHDDITAGSESKTAYDPEDGAVPVGGIQTAEDLTVTRMWKLTRESVKYARLKALRGRPVDAVAIIHERDPITGQPVSATPLETLKVLVKEVVKPGGQSGGSDEVKISVTLTVQP
jgi:hypothetical protein